MELILARQFFLRWARFRTALILFVLLLPFNLYLFPRRTTFLRSLSGIEAPIIDTWFGYSPARVFDLADRLGQTGRDYYVRSQFTLDIAYPLLYCLLLSILLLLFLPKALNQPALSRRLTFLPVTAMALDYLENAGIVTLLFNYPRQMVVLAWLTSLFSSLKITVLVICTGMVIISAFLAWKNNRV